MQGSWNKSEKCLDRDGLADLFRQRVSRNNRNLIKYIVATAIVCTVLEFLAPGPFLVGAAIVFVMALAGVMCFKNRGYSALMDDVRAGNFTWASGRLQSKYHRSMLDISSKTPAYSIMFLDEWLACDASTFIECEIGDRVILVKTDDLCFGLPVPSHVSCKNGMFRLKSARA